MVGYRCYLMDDEDHIFLARYIECDDDAQATTAAQDLLMESAMHETVEVWQQSRLISRLGRSFVPWTYASALRARPV